MHGEISPIFLGWFLLLYSVSSCITLVDDINSSKVHKKYKLKILLLQCDYVGDRGYIDQR